LTKHDQWHARMDPCLGRYKAEEFKNLINLWTSGFQGKKILKTDLKEEAFGEDEILFSLPREAQVYGLDIAARTVYRADQKQNSRQLRQRYIVADIRQIPFIDNTFDFVFSTSTLDHFKRGEDLTRSLIELRRVMKPGGTMILLVNNKFNLNAFVMFKLERALKLIDYPVQFYSLKDIKEIVTRSGWSVEDQGVTVHILSPVNTLLKIGRKFLPQRFMDFAAEVWVKFARWLSKRKTKILTGWFIALKCVKE